MSNKKIVKQNHKSFYGSPIILPCHWFAFTLIRFFFAFAAIQTLISSIFCDCKRVCASRFNLSHFCLSSFCLLVSDVLVSFDKASIPLLNSCSIAVCQTNEGKKPPFYTTHTNTFFEVIYSDRETYQTLATDLTVVECSEIKHIKSMHRVPTVWEMTAVAFSQSLFHRSTLSRCVEHVAFSSFPLFSF